MIVSWMTTNRCNLTCRHCYQNATPDALANELSTDEARTLIDQIARAGFKIMIFSGGEPLMRPDIYGLVSHAAARGLRPVFGTNGTLVTPEVARRLKEAGACAMGISLDSIDAARHDEFRGLPGAFEATVAGMRACAAAGLPFQIHTTAMEWNEDEVCAITDFAVEMGAVAHYVFFLIPVGRGRYLQDTSLEVLENERLLRRIMLKQREVPIDVKPTCAPQFTRVAEQLGVETRFARGCLAGDTYCIVSPEGVVRPCAYMVEEAGSVREAPFDEIWRDSELFARLRSHSYGGACGVCDYRKRCGGCRARAAYYHEGDYMAQDDYCAHGQGIALPGEEARAGHSADARLTRREALGGMAVALATVALAGPALALGAEAAAGDGAPAATGTPVDDGPQTTDLPAEFVDDRGRTVRVESTGRVVACMGSLARLWDLAGGSLAGVSSDAQTSYPELGLPDDAATVGDFAALSLEEIVALEPTLVLMSAASGGRGRGRASSQVDVGEALAATGVPVAFFDLTTFEDYLRVLQTCCDLTGDVGRYATYGEDVAARVAEVVAAVPAGVEPPTVALLITYSGGMRVQDFATTAGAMLAELGAVNIADETPSLLSDYSAEALLACDPDVVFVVPMGDDEESARRALEEQTANDPAWSALSAVQGGRCHLLSARGFLYKPLDRWDASYRELYGYLYGDAPAGRSDGGDAEDVEGAGGGDEPVRR